MLPNNNITLAFRSGILLITTAQTSLLTLSSLLEDDNHVSFISIFVFLACTKILLLPATLLVLHFVSSHSRIPIVGNMAVPFQTPIPRFPDDSCILSSFWPPLLLRRRPDPQLPQIKSYQLVQPPLHVLIIFQ